MGSALHGTCRPHCLNSNHLINIPPMTTVHGKSPHRGNARTNKTENIVSLCVVFVCNFPKSHYRITTISIIQIPRTKSTRVNFSTLCARVATRIRCHHLHHHHHHHRHRHRSWANARRGCEFSGYVATSSTRRFTLCACKRESRAAQSAYLNVLSLTLNTMREQSYKYK